MRKMVGILIGHKCCSRAKSTLNDIDRLIEGQLHAWHVVKSLMEVVNISHKVFLQVTNMLKDHLELKELSPS